MNRRYLLIGMVAASLMAKAQAPDTVFVKKNLKRTEIHALFSLYVQDGNHSAVTGGRGTEQLTVYSADVSLERTTTAQHVVGLHAGADLISSASTDRIDFVMSSASRVDSRVHADVSYARNMPLHDATAKAGVGFSSESDYLSIPVLLSFEKRGYRHDGKVLLSAQAAFDDLRWGRYNHGFFHPQRLVYPVELRYREWYDTYRRTTWQVTAGYIRNIGARLRAGVFPGFIHQHGLLATPFHRVVFAGDSLRPENLPADRYRFPASLHLTWMTAPQRYLISRYTFYSDNFGILAHAVEGEFPAAVLDRLTVSPFLRYYVQTGSRWFAPYGIHLPEEQYATSDYDLSSFSSLKAGLAFTRPSRHGGWLAGGMELRISTYFRSDGLTAHALSLLWTPDAGTRKSLKSDVPSP